MRRVNSSFNASTAPVGILVIFSLAMQISIRIKVPLYCVCIQYYF
nr:MAG TPA: hypothetical protein [Caudoviricetes sp.]